jgi:hypothetical protein
MRGAQSQTIPAKLYLSVQPCWGTSVRQQEIRAGKGAPENTSSTYGADLAEGMELFVRLPCERCGRLAKLHMRREIKPAH